MQPILYPAVTRITCSATETSHFRLNCALPPQAEGELWIRKCIPRAAWTDNRAIDAARALAVCGEDWNRYDLGQPVFGNDITSPSEPAAGTVRNDGTATP